MRTCACMIIFLLLLSCSEQPADNKDRTTRLNDIFDEIDHYDDSPEDSLYRGKHPLQAWSSVADTAQRRRAGRIQEFIDELQSIEESSLSEQESISRRVMIFRLQNQVDRVSSNMHLIPFNAEGGFYNSMSFVLSNLPFNTTDDYRLYLAWLPEYNKRLQENLALLRLGVEKKVVAPAIVVKNTLQLLEPWRKPWSESVYYRPFNSLPDNTPETDRQYLLEQAKLQVSAIQQTYDSIYAFFEGDYMASANEEPGISLVPGGKAYYANRVRHYTTLDITPDSVHQLGLSEVTRIRQSMDSIIQALNYKGSYAQFLNFLRTDAQFYPTTPQELLNRAAWLSKKAEGQLPRLFKKLYSLPFTVEPVPDHIAPTYTTGRYVGGSWDTQRAGIYWVNTYNLPSRTLYTLPALTLHEAVPGHHLQNALVAELDSLPSFRNNFYISAFGEGWGLYSEYLGEEMGMYETPYELFGRYTYEMWRACRLVVDTGMHDKGWSRQQALDYMASNTALSLHEVTTEIDRYIGWPGQALSYKIGEIKIKALREHASRSLGDRFDVREFHHVVLRNGSIPLDILEDQVNAYIMEATEKNL